MSVGETLTLTFGGAGAAVALATLVKAFIEYSQQGRQKRAEQFFELRRRLKETPHFAELAELLDLSQSGDQGIASGIASDADTKLAQLPFRFKRDYLGLFEEIAIAMNSGLIRPQVAHYMFGYYAILCCDNRAFWSDVNRLSEYWSLFDDFCTQMKREQGRFHYRRKDFQF